jgi:isopentenyl-diphosphate Delta-isomerase
LRISGLFGRFNLFNLFNLSATSSVSLPESFNTECRKHTFALPMEENTQRSIMTDRKQDHIDLAFRADMSNKGPDDRFYYEPMLAGHPQEDVDLGITFLGKTLRAPIWVSSMTGGTEMAYAINRRLAQSCARFGLGMGLGSCRPLLDNLDRLKDFDVREIIGPNLPLFANLGIAQIEYLLEHGRAEDIQIMLDRLKADGLVVHINPLQEWLQPEGDFILNSPIDTLGKLLDRFSFPVIVKEVGQGMGPESIAAILRMPVAALELAAHGGTNFSKLELLRSTAQQREVFDQVTRLGHTAGDMISWINEFMTDDSGDILCRQFIISGGIRDFLDGYYWMQKLNAPSLYGQASGFLKYAAESQESLDEYILSQIRGLQLAQNYLKVK